MVPHGLVNPRTTGMCPQEGPVFRPQHVLNSGPGDQQLLGAGPVLFAAEQPIRILVEASGLGGIK